MAVMEDSNRPPVLAHQRFVADRAAFAGLSLRERFQRIHDTNLWGAAESISGLGSELDATAVLRAELPDLLRQLGVRRLLDAPCGDGGWIATADLGVSVTGVDVVPDLIEALQRRGDPNRDYLLADVTCDPLPPADAILCRDCLVHFSFANIAGAIENFRRTGATWLITTTFPEWQTNVDCEDGDWRALNFERAPFEWGVPRELLNENCMEADGGWRDKSLGVWRLSDVAISL
jgi:SAM-dependent methyltransferase